MATRPLHFLIGIQGTRRQEQRLSGVLARFAIPLSVARRWSITERADGELVSGNYFDVLGVRRCWAAFYVR